MSFNLGNPTFNKKNMRGPLMIAGWVILGILASGCGRLSGPYVPMAPQSAYNRSVNSFDPTTSGNSLESGYSCPLSANVLQDFNYQDFTVCTSQTSQYQILVHGPTRDLPALTDSNSICVFPAQVINSSSTYTKPDPTTNLPMYQCVAAHSTNTRIGVTDAENLGSSVTFPATNYNAIYVVDYNNRLQMQACLVGGNYFQCPRYAFGRFRN